MQCRSLHAHSALLEIVTIIAKTLLALAHSQSREHSCTGRSRPRRSTSAPPRAPRSSRRLRRLAAFLKSDLCFRHLVSRVCMAQFPELRESSPVPGLFFPRYIKPETQKKNKKQQKRSAFRLSSSSRVTSRRCTRRMTSVGRLLGQKLQKSMRLDEIG